MLDSKLVEAERAWERFNQLTSPSGKAAEVARSAEGIAEAKRIREAEGFRAPSRVGPLLALLILLWPSSTAGPAYDELPPALKARQELEAKLREVAKASQQVRVEIEAARKRLPKGAPRPGPKEQPKLVPERGPKPQPGGQGQPPGDEPPCELKGSGGPGQFKPAGPPVITCRYWCGDVQVILTDVWGTSPGDCEHPNVLKRAMRTAAELRRQNAAKKPKDGF